MSSNLGPWWVPSPHGPLFLPWGGRNSRTHGEKEGLGDADVLGGDAMLRCVTHYSGL